ncbi:MAG: YjbH domain-containing protein, partial [Saprospiraceae bacterium]
MYQKAIILFFFALFFLSTVSAQREGFQQYTSNGVLGQSGLVMIPTAQLAVDRAIVAGWSYIPIQATVREFSQLNNLPEFIHSARLNFLPFLELSIRFTKTKDVVELGDRSIFARVQLLKETGKRPAVAIGAHDLFGQVPHYHSVYTVVSKHFSLKKDLILGGHLGYGISTREEVQNEQLQGVFGGSTLRYRFAEIGLEYDGVKT